MGKWVCVHGGAGIANGGNKDSEKNVGFWAGLGYRLRRGRTSVHSFGPKTACRPMYRHGAAS